MQGESVVNASEPPQQGSGLRPILKCRGGVKKEVSVRFADKEGGRLAVLHEYESEGPGLIQVKTGRCCVLS